MERFEVGMLAKALAGHDLGKIYVIMDVDEEYVYLVDGKIRTFDKPKKKRKKHVQLIKETSQTLIEKIQSNQKIQNEDIKRVIKLKLSQGGNANV